MGRNISGSWCGRMSFDRETYKEEFNKLLAVRDGRKFFIRESTAEFKVKKFIKKGVDSLALAHSLNDSNEDAKDYWTITICYYAMLYMAKAAILTKGYETDDHYATQIALGHLLIPDQIEREDLELLEQAHKIFENDYVDYFEDARKESSTSRYSATKKYTEKRVKEILQKATKFISKIEAILKE